MENNGLKIVENLDGWTYDIAEGNRTVGVKELLVIKCESLDDLGEELFVVAMAEINNIADWNEPLHEIINKVLLFPFTFSEDEIEVIEVFDDELTARKFAAGNYDKNNVTKKLLDRYEQLKTQVKLPPLFTNIISCQEAGVYLGLSELKVREKCENKELLAKKIDDTWMLDKSYLFETLEIAVWAKNDGEKIAIPSNEIKVFHQPKISIKAYYELNKSEFNCSFNQVNWDRVLQEINENFSSQLVEVNQFSEEFALAHGFEPRKESDIVYYGYEDKIDSKDKEILWSHDFDDCLSYLLSEENISLSDGLANEQIGYEMVHRVLSLNGDFVEDGFMVIRAACNGCQYNQLVFEDSLEETLNYVQELDDYMRDISEYEELFLTL